MSELVTCVLEEHVAWVTLDRPDVRNALSFDTLVRLREVVVGLAQDERARVVVVTGAGDRAFCAGADLKERVGFTLERTTEFVHLIGDVFSEVAALPQPTIAVLQGVAFGGGLELALACDVRIAARGVALGLTETALAIIPGAGGTQRLARLVGLGRARDIVYSGRFVAPDEALAIGLAHRVLPGSDLLAAALEDAARLAAGPTLAIAAAKQAMIDGWSEPIDDALEIESRGFRSAFATADAREGVAAFLEKREPRFSGS